MLPPLISIATILVAFSAIIVNAAPPKIDPNYSTLYILEKRGVNMTCTAAGASDEKWTKDGSPVTDFGFKRTKKFEVGTGETSVTISKAVMSVTDSGSYSCTSGNENRMINLKVVSVTATNADYNRTMETATLACTISNVAAAEYSVVWLYKDKVVVEDEKYKIIKENNTLVIVDPVEDDVGEYECDVIFSRQSLKLMAKMFGKPYFRNEKANSTVSLSENQSIDLTCNANGYPKPDVAWLKDDDVIQQKGRVTITDTGSGSRLQIADVLKTDAGIYVCNVENSLGRKQRSFVVSIQGVINSASYLRIDFAQLVLVLCFLLFAQ